MQYEYLESMKKQFMYYKMLADKTFQQVGEHKINWQFNKESNSLVMIVKHMSGNMISRWTDFLHSDGEKEWRDREKEFDTEELIKEAMLRKWESGWKVFFDTLDSLQEEDLEKIVFIRNTGHSVLEAINRQLAHYSYHVGQIIFIGKMISNDKWTSLSIPKGASASYNKEKFSKPAHLEHFTEEFLPVQNSRSESGKSED